MTMPLIPGLMGDEVEVDEDSTDPEPTPGGGLTELLNSLDEVDLADLIEEANEAYMNGVLDETMNGAPAEGEGEETPDEGEGEEAEEEQPGEGEVDAETAATNAGAIVGEIQAIQSQLTELADVVDESEIGDDVDVDDALDTVAEALTEAEDAQADAEAAASEGDIEAANEAMKVAEKALEKATEVCDKVKEAAGDAVTAAEEEVEPDPLALWAAENS